MARVVKLVSDVTGKEDDEAKFVKVVVRNHPSADEAKQLDVLPGELDALKSVEDLVVLEVGSNGDKTEIVVNHKEFEKLVSDNTVKNAPGTRGRPKGWSPTKS